MEYLASVNVPMSLPDDVMKIRQSTFDNAVDTICKKYLEKGFEFKRGFVFNETHEENIRIMWPFPKDLNIPMEMQKELANEWVKLFL